MVFIERCELLRILYDHINDKSKIHDHAPVLAYNSTEDGVAVTLVSGASHHGDVLIGADGTHSQVRKFLAEKISHIDPANINAGMLCVPLSLSITLGLVSDQHSAFKSEYKAVFGVSRNDAQRPFMPDGTMYNSYYSKYSAVAVTGVPGLVFWFLFIKTPLDRSSHVSRFAIDDLEAVIDQYKGTGVGPGFAIEDLWKARVKVSMAPLEEGVLSHWSHGRVLLLGDSVHKVCQPVYSGSLQASVSNAGPSSNTLSGYDKPRTRR